MHNDDENDQGKSEIKEDYNNCDKSAVNESQSEMDKAEKEHFDNIEVVACSNDEGEIGSHEEAMCNDFQVGLMRNLTNSETKLLKRLKIDINPELHSLERRTIVLAELLILTSFVLRIILSAYLEDTEMAEGGSTFSRTVARIIQGDRDGNSSVTLTAQDNKRIHIIGSSITATFFLPQLFLLGLLPEKGLNLIVQLLVSLVTLGVGSYNLNSRYQISEYYRDHEPDKLQCQERFSCNHASVSHTLYIIVILFVVTTILRILFRTKYRFNIINIKCLGIYIEFFLSRRSRDFQSLTMLLFLTFTVISGSVLNMKQRFRGVKSVALDRETEVVVDAIYIVFTVTWLLLLFWIYCQVHHRYTHTMLVRESLLEQELAMLGDRHKEALLDNKYSKYSYCPHSKEPDHPVNSGQRYDGRVMENSNVMNSKY